MSLDWQQFIEIVESNRGYDDKHAQLMTIINQRNFLVDFLTQLLKELKEIKTTSAIVDKFPEAGLLLTKASTHPYFGCTPSVAELLITCLIEYAKLDLDSSIEMSLDLTTLNNKSIIWCIIRLRRFISVSKKDRETSDTQFMIQKISEMIDANGGKLKSKKITSLTDACLSLIHAEEATQIIQKLVDCALIDEVLDNVNFDRPEPLLSESFIYQLANNNDTQTTMRTHYLSWPNDLKMKLLTSYDELLEFEILELIEKFTITQSEYTSIDTLEAQFLQNEFIQLLRLSPHLIQRVTYYLSNYVIQFQNWKLVRLVQCINHCLISRLNAMCRPIISTADYNQVESQKMYEIISDYVFGDGAILETSKRRNEAWCLVLSFHRFLWYCIYQIVQWCKNDKLWSRQMEHNLVYINWVVYPSMDNRESESLSFLRHWIQSSSGNNKLFDELPKRWHNLLNGNGVLVTCFVTSIFFSIDHLHVDQQISLIESIFAKPDQPPQPNIHGNPKKSCPDAGGMVYMMLDYLNDMEIYADLYPPRKFDIEIIKNHIYEKYL